MINILWLLSALLLSLQWVVIRLGAGHVDLPWQALLPGLAIVGAAFLLTWTAEVAQLSIPQALAIAAVALIAVLPEYAVDLYFAWTAGKDPSYTPYATANMTGANRLLIGLGWPAVLLAFWFFRGGKKITLPSDSRIEFAALFAATAYSFCIPLKGTLSLVDTAVLLFLFGFYLYWIIQSHHVEVELEGPADLLARLPYPWKWISVGSLFAFAAWAIYLSSEPFAEGLLDLGKEWGIEEFLLVQWLAPLASESPEFIVAIIFAVKNHPSVGLRTLVASKVNQWTLLVGMLPLAYCVSSGALHPMRLDSRQAEEIFLTSAQSLFALFLLANFEFSLKEAAVLAVLFCTQVFFTDPWIRYLYAGAYLAASAYIWICGKKSVLNLFRGWKDHPLLKTFFTRA